MVEPYIGQISMVAFSWPPRNWATCDGQLMSIAQNTALFSLIGTTYGGDGRTTFALPDLRGRVPIHQGQGPGLTPRTMGEKSGSENVTLLMSEMPMHNHLAAANSTTAGSQSPANAFWAKESEGVTLIYGATSDGSTMNPQAIGLAGGNQPHNNMQPFLVINFVICLYGVFPSRN